MAKKKSGDATPISSAVRRAIKRSGLSRYQISEASGIGQASLSRFIHGECGLTTTSLDKLAPVLGLRIILDLNKRDKRYREKTDE
jgi:transcriptional regulator with XRE-family HTH domain